MRVISASVIIHDSPYKDLIGEEGQIFEEFWIKVNRNGKEKKYKLSKAWELEFNSATMHIKL